jgi:uncharacterized protein YcnI
MDDAEYSIEDLALDDERFVPVFQRQDSRGASQRTDIESERHNQHQLPMTNANRVGCE